MVSNEGIEIPLNEKEAKLMSAIADELMQRSINITPGSCMYFAGYLVKRIVQEGWQWHPPKLEDFDLEHNKVVLTPHQEIDMMDRIISGLPVKLYDVNSLHPQEVDIWKQIPDFENYEANPIGAVRSKWTKRVLEETDVDGQTMVEMHDKDGYPHEVNIRYVVEKTFTK